MADEAPKSPCCRVDVMELRDSTEYWRVESVKGEDVEHSTYIRSTEISDHRGFECAACSGSLRLAPEGFEEASTP